MPLPPEFVVREDGREKQDGKIRAASRWVDAWGTHYAPWGVTLLGDDLYAHQPFGRRDDRRIQFSLHLQALLPSYNRQWVDDFARSGQIGTHSVILERSQGKPKSKRIP